MWKQIEPFDLLKSIPAKNIVWLVITVTKIAFSLLQSTYQKLWQKHPEKTDTEKVPGLDKIQQTLRCKCFKVTRKAMCAFLNVWSFCHLSELILVFSLRAVALLSVRHSQHIGIMHKHVELLCFIIIQSCCFLLKFVFSEPTMHSCSLGCKWQNSCPECFPSEEQISYWLMLVQPLQVA